jgi:nitroimidazol reductase NimA-like FMN-containing flavoprotein (pyridoxamine 5'-phosphate oxidase superfamily)
MLNPIAGRPEIPGYGIPETLDGVLPWSHVDERMRNSLNYWIGTTDANGRPHATPVWGVWLDGVLYFDGSPQTRRGRNLALNPAVVVHLEDGTAPVILQGEAHEIVGIERVLAERIAKGYAGKYEGYAPEPDTWKSGGIYRLSIQTAYAWTSFPNDATRWKFSGA